MIELNGLHVIFNKGLPTMAKALNGVDLKIPSGQFVTVIGGNGAGKSTLLNAISGDVSVDSGRVFIGGEDVTRKPTHKRAPLVARVFQDPVGGTCGELTIEENLALARSRGAVFTLRAATNAAFRAEFRDRLAALGLGLENRLNDRMDLLSGGQRQAVTLLMATLAPAQILLLDEHIAALDPNTADFVMNLTRSVVEEAGLTCIMVTHSMRNAVATGDRVVMMHHGRILADIEGDERRGLTVDHLLRLFAQTKGEALDEDRMLLA